MIGGIITLVRPVIKVHGAARSARAVSKNPGRCPNGLAAFAVECFRSNSNEDVLGTIATSTALLNGLFAQKSHGNGRDGTPEFPAPNLEASKLKELVFVGWGAARNVASCCGFGDS